MPRIYTLQEKRHAVWLYKQIDSIPAVSEHLQIPKRTIRDWVLAYKRGLISPAKSPAVNYQGKSGSISLAELRDRTLEQIEILTRNPAVDPRQAYFASLTIERLLEQVRMLNDTIGITPPALEPGDTQSPSSAAGSAAGS